MSDMSQGPGWWLASDGKWYPPEAWTGPIQRTGVPTIPSYGVPLPARPTNGLAVASLICSCVGIIPFLFGIPCILGIIFGFVARSQIRGSGNAQEGAGLALAGIIIGFTLIGIFIVAVALIAAFANATACNRFNAYSCSFT